MSTVHHARTLPRPTPRPTQSANVAQDSRPEIGGSFGGFIAVVVALASIFLFACIGIFVLLRNHEPTRHERQARRAHARARADRAFVHDVPLGPPGMRDRIARLFGRRGGSGWIKASGEDGDEWDARDVDGGYPHARSPADHAQPAPQLSERVRDDAARAPASFPPPIAPADSTDSIEIELRAPTGEYVSPAKAAPPVGAHTPPESLRDSPTTMVAEEDDDFEPRDERHFSVQSGKTDTGSVSIRSMRKFDNGTKFREGLSS